MATSVDPIPTETATPKIQHCAWCLTEGSDMKHCAQCKKRAYCSRECQAKDWSKEGQGHKNWCKLECGEEDVDWIIQDIPGRGIGLIALRDFRRGVRIMVDRGYTAWEIKQHPQRLATLEPEGGTLKEKFEYNQLNAKPLPLVCFHTIRTLHSCSPNAAHWIDEKFQVDVLYSRRKIKAGDEITVAYHDFRAMDHFVTPEETRSALEQNCGIVCPSDCACRDEIEVDQVRHAQRLERTYLSLARGGRIKEAFEVVKNLLRLFDDMNIGIAALDNASSYAYLFGIRHKSTLKEGVDIMKRALAVFSGIFHPKSGEILAMQASIENPRIHPDYLIGNSTEGLVFKDGPLADFEPFEYVLQDYDVSTGEDPVEFTIRKTHEMMQELCSGRVRASTTPPGEIPHCSLCRKVCQIHDWKLMNGRAHQYWGKLECGEQDVDWVIELKKVKAKRDFPRGSRIMVERGTPIAPIEAVFKDPKQANSKPAVFCSDALIVRHSCSPNASFIYEKTSKVIVVFAERDIKAGEEITMAYVPVLPSVDDVTRILKQDFGITCPENCACRDPVKLKRIQEADEMDKACLRLVKEGRFLEAFEMTKKLLDLYDVIGAQILMMTRTSVEAFRSGIRFESTFDEAVEILRRSFNIVSQFAPPKSTLVLKMNEYLRNPSIDPWFKIGDQVDSDDEKLFRPCSDVSPWSLPRGFKGFSGENSSPLRSMLQNMGARI